MPNHRCKLNAQGTRGLGRLDDNSRCGVPNALAHSRAPRQTWDQLALQRTHESYLRAVDETVGRLRAVETDLRPLLQVAPLQTRVQRLRCFRGMDDLTALTIAAELGDARRFASAPQTMAFVGLVPSEHSSGSKRA